MLYKIRSAFLFSDRRKNMKLRKAIDQVKSLQDDFNIIMLNSFDNNLTKILDFQNEPGSIENGRKVS